MYSSFDAGGKGYEGFGFSTLGSYCIYQWVVFVFFCLYGLVDEPIMCESEFDDLDG